MQLNTILFNGCLDVVAKINYVSANIEDMNVFYAEKTLKACVFCSYYILLSCIRFKSITIAPNYRFLLVN